MANRMAQGESHMYGGWFQMHSVRESSAQAESLLKRPPRLCEVPSIGGGGRWAVVVAVENDNFVAVENDDWIQ